MEAKFDASLDLLRRLDPKRVSPNLTDICTILQSDGGDELAQDLLSAVDTPLTVAKCAETGKSYLCCDYNRDGDLYRLPYSNKYDPPAADDSPYPSPELRQLEVRANEAFDVYRDLYYEGGGVSSVYMWDTEEEGLSEGFAGVVLIQKHTAEGRGKWDLIHVFEVVPRLGAAQYKVTTSVILDLAAPLLLLLLGNMTRQLESTQSLSVEGAPLLEVAHLVNLGQLVEKAEYNVRNLLQEVYFDKLKDILLKDIRLLAPVQAQRSEDARHSEVLRGLRSL